MTTIARFRAVVVRIVVLALFASTLALAAGTDPAAAETPPSFLLKWGTEGSVNGRFLYPRGVAADGDGNVYVADTFNDRIQKFTSTGTFLMTWGTTGSAVGHLSLPTGVAVDGDGNVYVADTFNDRIQKFTPTGVFLDVWGTTGSANGRFHDPSGVAVDANGNVYVSDAGNHRVQKFNASGDFVAKWSTGGSGEYNGPQGIAVDGSGNVYVADTYYDQILRFTANGTFVTGWGTDGYAEDVAVDTHGAVYVIGNNRMKKYTATGIRLAEWGATGSGNGQFYNSMGVAVDGSGNVYVADTDNSRIQKFGYPARPDGRIKKSAAGTFVGNNLYNTTGVGQTKTSSAARGSAVSYVVLAQNDAPFPNALRLKGTAGNTSFDVAYDVGGADVTAAVTAGTYTTPVLAPGATHRVKVTVTVRPTAPAGSVLAATLLLKSDTDPARRDTVKFVTSRA